MNTVRRTAMMCMAVCFLLYGIADTQIRIVCVGNSITAGAQNSAGMSYPSVLQRLLGAGYVVHNQGVSGRTTIRAVGDAYALTAQFHNIFTIKPAIIIIKLGTNDAKPGVWQHRNQFTTDYAWLVDTFFTIIPRPQIFILLPVPAFKPGCCQINVDTLNESIVPKVKAFAASKGLQVIDSRTPMLGRPDLFPDGIHPTDEGADTLAHIVYRALATTPARTLGHELGGELKLSGITYRSMRLRPSGIIVERALQSRGVGYSLLGERVEKAVR